MALRSLDLIGAWLSHWVPSPTSSVGKRAGSTVLAIAAVALASATTALATQPILAAQPGGKLLVTALRHDHPAIARLDQDGSLDRDFGKAGYSLTGFGRNAYELGMVVRANGAIDLAAVVDRPAHTLEIVQFDHHGKLDPQFGSNGVATVVRRSLVGGGLAARRRGDLFVGTLKCVAPPPPNTLSCVTAPVVVATRGNGQPDQGFGTNGETVLASATHEGFSTLSIAPSGAVIAGGSLYYPDDSILARLLPNGTPDPSFGGGDGFIETSTPIDGIARVPGGVTVGGAAGTQLQPEVFGLARFNADGSADSSFAGGAGATSTTRGGSTDTTGSLVRDSDGSLTIAGTIGHPCDAPPPSEPGCRTQIGLFRYTADGLVDASFGNEGFVSTPTTRVRHARTLFDQVAAVKTPLGLAVAAPAYHGSPLLVEAPLVVRYRSNGKLDPTFGKAGYVRFPTG